MTLTWKNWLAVILSQLWVLKIGSCSIIFWVPIIHLKLHWTDNFIHFSGLSNHNSLCYLLSAVSSYYSSVTIHAILRSKSITPNLLHWFEYSDMYFMDSNRHLWHTNCLEKKVLFYYIGNITFVRRKNMCNSHESIFLKSTSKDYPLHHAQTWLTPF